jgi:hypothetical protein
VIRSFSRFRFQAALFLAVVSAALGLSSVAGAQDIKYSLQNSGVETTAAFSANTSSTQVVTYAYAVITDYTLWEEGYWVAVEGDLSDNGSWVDSGYQDNGFTSAKVSLSDPINLGHVYGILATSGVCWWEDEGDGFGYEDCDAPWTQAYLYGTLGAPSISSISPSGGTIGKSGTITVSGQDLIDPFTSKASASITGSGVTLSVNGTPSNTSVALNYSIASNATAGNQNLTLSSRLGTSNAEQFTVGYPPAVVTNVSPSVWTAGQQTSVTITGTGFGTAPTLSATGTGVNLTLNSASPDGTTIHATATVALTAPSENVTVTVQPGYAGSGFYCNCPPDQANGTDTVTVQPVQAPVPTIFRGLNANNQCQGNSITNQNQPVVVGQLIQFTGCVPNSVSSIPVSSSSWQVNDATFYSTHVTAGFVITPTAQGAQGSGGYLPLSPSTCNGKYCDFAPKFYFVTQGTYTFTYSYSLSNGTSNSASVTYVVKGPTPTGRGIASGEDGEIDCASTAFICASDPGNASLLTSGTDTSLKYLATPSIEHPFSTGILFHIAATDPEDSQTSNPSAYQWVQLLAPSTDRVLAAGIPPSASQEVQPAGLDNFYPYPQGDNTPDRGTYAGDSPGVEISYNRFNGYTITAIGEYQDSFQATMYLLWDPSLNADGVVTPGCAASRSYSAGGDTTNTISQTSQCSGSIPVPLASVTWGYCGNAIQTLQPAPANQNNGWIVSCSANSPLTPTYTDAESYGGFQTWTNLVKNTY